MREPIYQAMGQLHFALRDLEHTADWQAIEGRVHGLREQVEKGTLCAEQWGPYGQLEKELKMYAELKDRARFASDYAHEALQAGEDQTRAATDVMQTLDEICTFILDRRLSGTHDQENAFITIQVGVGNGAMSPYMERLAGAYSAMAQRLGLEVEIVDIEDKTLALYLSGNRSYGFFRGEHGAHRVEYRLKGKSQTGHLTVIVEPEIIRPEFTLTDDEIRVETLAAGGPGGQHANRSHTAVRLTYLPEPSISATARMRSQQASLRKARDILFSRVAAYQERQQELDGYSPARVQPSWGHRFRTYDTERGVIRDHQSHAATSDMEGFFRGNIDEFILRYHGISFKDSF